MLNKSKKFRLSAVALIAASAAVSGVATPASASDPSPKAASPSPKAASPSPKTDGPSAEGVWGFPGEGNEWNLKTYSGGRIDSRSTPGEARDNRGNVLTAWRGYDNDYIWVSLNSGPAIQLRSPGNAPAVTWAPPTVIWTNDGNRGNFRVFHTGTDGHVYQNRIQLDASYHLPGTLAEGIRIPNDTRTNDTVAVGAAALPNNSFMLAWNSQSNDDIWTMYYDGATTNYSDPRVVPGALSKDAPSLAAQVDDGNDSAPWNQVVLAFTGTDNTIYWARQRYGTSDWTYPRQIVDMSSNGWTRKAPSVALSPNGYGIITMSEDRDTTIGSYLIRRDGGWSGYYQENTYALAHQTTPLAVMDGTTFYYVLNGTAGGLGGGIKWKKVADLNSIGLPWAQPPQW